MSGLSTVAVVCVCALAGMITGFAAGLVPGLHMNNIAALFSAYAGSVLGAFAGLSEALGSGSSGLSVSSFLSAAVVGHVIAESVPSTYVGIPSGDVVSVLPAHRLSRAGLGRSAVRASADGALVGVFAATVLLVPMSLLMGEPVHFYDLLRRSMVGIVVLVSCVLLLCEGFEPTMRGGAAKLVNVLRGTLVFAGSGLLGLVVLKSNFYSCALPDLPWMPDGFVPREALLLPMFAGLFGIPSLLLSIGSARVFDLRPAFCGVHCHKPGFKDLVLSLIGGTVVGWMPGMTSGAAATLCAPAAKETVSRGDIPSSLRFIWLYSSISGAGTVFALGALFTIMRARSGTMDAVEMFLGRSLEYPAWPSSIPILLPLALSMILSALVAHSLLRVLDSRIRNISRLMGSRNAALAAMAFIVSLSFALTGSRGMVLLAASACLGLIPPLAGVRRILLMGCLLVPICATLLGAA